MKNTQKIILSFVFVLATAFTTHYFLVQRIDSKNSDREVASFGDRNSQPQISWEQRVAAELSQSTSTQVGVKPSWQDILVYEYLAGQYDIVGRQGQIEKLNLQPEKMGVDFETKDFVERYVKKMKAFSNYKIESRGSKMETVLLYDQQGENAGSVQIDRNDKGLVQAILIQ